MTANGSGVDDRVYNGEVITTRPNHYNWPIQPKPHSTDWHFWKHAITTCFTSSGLRAQLALGPWVDSDNTWIWFFVPAEERLYERTPHGWCLWIL